VISACAGHALRMRSLRHSDFYKRSDGDVFDSKTPRKEGESDTFPRAIMSSIASMYVCMDIHDHVLDSKYVCMYVCPYV
jgi:hypothetical protein